MKILIADDHPLVRIATRLLIQELGGFQVVGEASDFGETLKLLGELRPDLLVLDLEMPGGSAEEVATTALKLLPALKILILTAHNDDKFLRRFAKIRIAGYVLKDEGPESLQQAIRTTAEGASWFSHAVIHRLMNLNNEPPLAVDLTAREKMLLMLIAAGKDNQAIAQQVGLAEQTVRNYCSQIYSKLQVAGRIDAILWARKHGIVEE